MDFIATLSDIHEHEPYTCMWRNISIVIYKTKNGIFALRDTCSHEQYPLSLSQSEDSTVECQKHGSVFDLETGQPLSLPALEPVETFKVVVEDGNVYLIP